MAQIKNVDKARNELFNILEAMDFPAYDITYRASLVFADDDSREAYKELGYAGVNNLRESKVNKYARCVLEDVLICKPSFGNLGKEIYIYMESNGDVKTFEDAEDGRVGFICRTYETPRYSLNKMAFFMKVAVMVERVFKENAIYE